MSSSPQTINHFGLWLYLMTDCVLFASLFATYAVLLPGVADGPGPSELFDPHFILVSTIVLLLSTLSAGVALVMANHNYRKYAVIAMVITGLLGALFVGMELYEFSHILHDGYSWQTSAFLSSFFTLVGLHGAHIIVGLIWLVTLLVMITRKGLTSRIKNSLGLFTMFWHFLDVIWIFIFTFVYMTGVIL